MCDELKNLNIDTCSASELKTLIRQALPIVITFVKAGQKLLSEDTSKHNPCKNCDKYNTCEESCELLENKLSGIHEGSQNLERTYGNLINEISDAGIRGTDDNDEILHKFDINYLKAIDRIRADDIYMLYKNCSYIFTEKEWRVITLKIEEAQTFKTIGVVLGISTSTASDTFQRAKRRKERYYQKNT